MCDLVNFVTLRLQIGQHGWGCVGNALPIFSCTHTEEQQYVVTDHL